MLQIFLYTYRLLVFLVKVDDSGKAELIYESNGLQLINIVDKTLVVQDSNTIYTMSLNGKKVKKLYTMDMTGEIIFEVVVASLPRIEAVTVDETKCAFVVFKNVKKD